MLQTQMEADPRYFLLKHAQVNQYDHHHHHHHLQLRFHHFVAVFKYKEDQQPRDAIEQ